MAKNYFLPMYNEKIVASPPLFHEQLRYERERRGWSQADLAEKMRCDTKTIGRWESGVSLPQPYHRQALAELLEKNLEELGLLQKVVSFPVRKNGVENAQMPIQKGANNHDTSIPLKEDWEGVSSIANLHKRESEYIKSGEWIDKANGKIVLVVILECVGMQKPAKGTKARSQLSREKSSEAQAGEETCTNKSIHFNFCLPYDCYLRSETKISLTIR